MQLRCSVHMFNLEIKTRFGQQWLQFVCEAPCKTSKECASQRHGLHFFTRQVKLSYIYIYKARFLRRSSGVCRSGQALSAAVQMEKSPSRQGPGVLRPQTDNTHWP